MKAGRHKEKHKRIRIGSKYGKVPDSMNSQRGLSSTLKGPWGDPKQIFPSQKISLTIEINFMIHLQEFELVFGNTDKSGNIWTNRHGG